MRRSITSGQLENTIGWPGLIALTITRLASVSASDCARNPASVAGAVATGLRGGDAGQRDIVFEAFKRHIHRVLAKPHRVKSPG